MSYQMVNTISFYKDGRVTVNSAASNVVPAKYETYEVFSLSDVGPEEKRRYIFEHLVRGNLRFNYYSSNRTNYAYQTMLHYLKDEYDMKLYDLWPQRTTLSNVDLYKVKKEVYRVFREALNSDINVTEKRYAVQLDNGYWVQQEMKYNIRVTEKQQSSFHIAEAMYYAYCHDGEIAKV